MINLLPMAGLGNRFMQQLYNVPKPFIPIMGEPMFIAAIKSFPPADRYIFICRREHQPKLKELVQRRLGRFEIVVLDEMTEGQACTCLAVEDMVPPEEGLFISSCDYQTIFDQNKYAALLNDPEIDIIIWTFKIGSIKKADPAAFAYCRTEGDRVLEVVEKKVISSTPHLDPAVVGSFTYKRSELFFRGAKQMIHKNIRVNGEFYVGTSINQLIANGYRVAVFEVDKFISFGNPLELNFFHYWQDYFDQLDDHPYSINYGFKRSQK